MLLNVAKNTVNKKLKVEFGFSPCLVNKYLGEEMLDDCGQSLHFIIPLDEQLLQLVYGLVLLFCLLFALVLFSGDRPICHTSHSWAGLGCTL